MSRQRLPSLCVSGNPVAVSRVINEALDKNINRSRDCYLEPIRVSSREMDMVTAYMNTERYAYAY